MKEDVRETEKRSITRGIKLYFFNDVDYIKMDGTEVLNMDDISKEEREG